MTDKILINNVNFLTFNILQTCIIKIYYVSIWRIYFYSCNKTSWNIVSFVIINFPFDDPVFYIL